ncbi:hypothetical protein HZC34_04125 [Candidatus Saganbacteria bacterium]|nr:hypothetical protein [Candidatus Saganbacteria bacterium]
MSEKEDNKDVGKQLLGLYLTRYQGEAYRQFDEKRGRDLLWPFKFVWFILAELWRLLQMLFGRSKQKP